MRVVGEYSFAGGAEFVRENFPIELDEVVSAIKKIDSEKCRTKVSKEKTMANKVLYSPVDLNKEFKQKLFCKNWSNYKIECEYSSEYYVNGYNPNIEVKRPFRDMDFVKNRLGVEVQFGKYAFMVYNVAAKMTIFRNLNVIDAGIEIVPVKEFANEMSTGVSYFEQFCWDLNKRGDANIDTPVLILGIAADA
jgi:hypothetical protein